MRAEFEAERIQNLGGLPRAYREPQRQSLRLPPPLEESSSKEPSAQERLTSPESFFGDTHAQHVLSALDLNFKKVEQFHIRTNNPVLDLGSSYSTLAIEGAFRSIAIYGTDLQYNKVRYGLLTAMRSRVSVLAEYYRDASQRPPGFECHSIPETAWEDCVNHGLSLVDSQMAECKASEIKLPNGKKVPSRYFSIVVSHHAVPKFSKREEFLDKELPELLRVTDDRLHLFPFVTAGPGDPLLHVPGSEGRRSVEDIAARAGFSVEIKVSPTCIGGPKKEPGFNMLGIFVRRR